MSRPRMPDTGSCAGRHSGQLLLFMGTRKITPRLSKNNVGDCTRLSRFHPGPGLCSCSCRSCLHRHSWNPSLLLDETWREHRKCSYASSLVSVAYKVLHATSAV